MLEVSQGEASGAGADELENSPARTETAGLAGEATDDFGPAFELTQRALEQVGAAQSLAQPERVAEVDAESRQVSGQASRRARVVGLELAHQRSESSLAISC